MEGPRSVRLDERESLSKLVDAVFMEGEADSMFHKYIPLFSERNH